MKIAHLHLQDGFGNKSTLICNLIDRSIKYTLYGGTSSSGTPFALSNLQCTLPVNKINMNETKEEFKNRLIDIINKHSVERVIDDIPIDITF